MLSWAQLYTGSVTGIVTDPSGAVVPGAEVSLTDIDRDTHSMVKTDGDGPLSFPLAFAGQLFIEGERSGISALRFPKDRTGRQRNRDRERDTCSCPAGR